MRAIQVLCVVVLCLMIFAVMSNLSTEGRAKPPRVVDGNDDIGGREPYSLINAIQKESKLEAEQGLDVPVATKPSEDQKGDEGHSSTSREDATAPKDTPIPEVPKQTPKHEATTDSNNDSKSELSEADFVAVTALNAAFFDKLRNFVGSIHKWEPEMRIVVYDIGLNKQQREQIETWKNLEVIDFDFDKYPSHVRELGNYAWKPLIMKEVLEKYPLILYTDPSVEYRQPPTMVKKQILEKGYWFVHQEGLRSNLRCCGPVLELCYQGTIDALGMSSDTFKNKFMCAGGMQGYRRGASAVKDVLEPTVQCALKKGCIAPPGSGIPNHRYDQCVFSLHINSGDYQCEKSERFYAYPQTVPGFKVADVEEVGPVVFHLARGRFKHYERFVEKKDS